MSQTKSGYYAKNDDSMSRYQRPLPNNFQSPKPVYFEHTESDLLSRRSRPMMRG